MGGTLESQGACDWCRIQFRCMSDMRVMIFMVMISDHQWMLAKNGFRGRITFSPAYVRNLHKQICDRFGAPEQISSCYASANYCVISILRIWGLTITSLNTFREHTWGLVGAPASNLCPNSISGVSRPPTHPSQQLGPLHHPLLIFSRKTSFLFLWTNFRRNWTKQFKQISVLSAPD